MEAYGKVPILNYSFCGPNALLLESKLLVGFTHLFCDIILLFLPIIDYFDLLSS